MLYMAEVEGAKLRQEGLHHSHELNCVFFRKEKKEKKRRKKRTLENWNTRWIITFLIIK